MRSISIIGALALAATAAACGDNAPINPTPAPPPAPVDECGQNGRPPYCAPMPEGDERPRS